MNQSDPSATPRGRIVCAIAVTVLVCLPILAAAQYVSHVRYDEHDSWMFAYFGRQMNQGQVLYEQLWDNKPPGIFWVNVAGLWMSRGSLAGPVALCALACVATCSVVFALSRRLYGWSAAAIVTMMASVYLYAYPYHVGCNRPSTFLVLTEITAVLFYCRSFEPSKHPRRNLWLAGFCAGLSLCFKQTGLAALAAIAVHHVYLLIRPGNHRRTIVSRGAIVLAGWAGAVAAAIAALALTSNLGWAWNAIVTFNRDYFAPGVGSKWWPSWFAQPEHERALGLPVILAVATLLHPALRRVWRYEGPPAVNVPGHRPAGLLVALWAWMLVAVYLALLGPHQRLHYWGVALPPLVMLAGHGIHLLLQSGRLAGTRRPAFHLVVGVVWFGYMMLGPLSMQLRAVNYYAYHAADADDPRQSRAVVDAIRSASQPDDALFVWYYNPKLYWVVDRPPAIRYLDTDKARQLGRRGQPLMDEMIQLLKQARPKIIVTDSSLFRRDDPTLRNRPPTPGDFPDWLRANYSHPPDSKRRDVWVRDD